MTSSGIKGYNFRVNDILQNEAPLPDPTFRFGGLLNDTEYKIGVSAVDRAGNESDVSVQYIRTNKPPVYVDPPMAAEDIAQIDTIVNGWLAQRNIQTGISVAITGPRGHLTKSYGSGMEVSNHFRIASGSKPFVSTLILMMVDRGLLSLDDVIEQYVPGLPNGNSVTIKNIMMMRAGWIDDQANTNMQMHLVLNPTATWDPMNNVNFMKTGAVQFEPDTSYQYVDGNFMILGFVLQAVTGRTMQDLFTNEIFIPLGMTETSFPDISNPNVPAPHGPGYWNNPIVSIPIIGWFFTNDITALSPGCAWCAGNIISTITDLSIWCREMRDGTLLSPESHALRADYFPYTYPNSPGSVNYPKNYQYGLGMMKFGSWRLHDGSFPGWDGVTSYETVTGATICVYENGQVAAPFILPAFSAVWADIVAYLYGDSASNENYNGPPRIEAKHAGLSMSAGGNVGSPPLTIPKVRAALSGITTQTGLVAVGKKFNASLIGTSKLSVEFESVGSGNQTSTQGVSALSWGHNTAGGEDVVIVGYNIYDYQNGSLSIGMKIGDIDFPLDLASGNQYYLANNIGIFMSTFAIFNPPAGLSTITAYAQGTGTVNDIAGNTVSYKNVGAIKTPITQGKANTAAPTVAGLALALGEMAVCGFGSITKVLTGFNKTQRWAQNVTDSVPMVIGDANGPGAINFTAAMTAAEPWGGNAVILQPVGA